MNGSIHFPMISSFNCYIYYALDNSNIFLSLLYGMNYQYLISNFFFLASFHIAYSLNLHLILSLYWIPDQEFRSDSNHKNNNFNNLYRVKLLLGIPTESLTQTQHMVQRKTQNVPISVVLKFCSNMYINIMINLCTI